MKIEASRIRSRKHLYLLLIQVGIFFFTTAPGTLLAQNPPRDPRGKICAWREELGHGVTGATMRVSGAEDRAIARIHGGRLEHRTHNFGDMGITSEGYYTSRYPMPDGSGITSWGWNMSMALAVGPGPWFGHAQVHESTGDFQNMTKADWEAQDGARGTQFPSWWFYGYPRFAHSHLPGTWPDSGWPAPEDVEDVWLGTETWKKWERCADEEAFCWFDDSHAGRNPFSSVLDISVRKRILGYSDFDAVFFQFELTNNSSYDYTPVFIGAFGDLGSPVYNSFIGFPRYDPTRQIQYNVGTNYDSTAGTHKDDEGHACCWFGFMWLESPTGSFKKDEFGGMTDNPDRVRTRLALTHWEDRAQEVDEALYSALTGDVQYLNALQARQIWKTDADKENPVLIQGEADWLALYDPDDADHYFYSASGPITFEAGESINFVSCVVAAYSEKELKETADIAQRYYQAKFRAAGPPPAPELSCPGQRAGPHGLEFNPDYHSHPIYFTDSGRVTLTWDGRASETTPDRNTGVPDFEGYKIYKSVDFGFTWGESIHDSRGRWAGYVPVAQFDLDNSIQGENPFDDFWIGEDTGLVHTWTDTDVLDGYEYWYQITAFDYTPADSTYESPMGGEPGTSSSIVAVIPGVRPAGWKDGALGRGAAAGASIDLYLPSNEYETTISAVVVDQSAITGDSYSVTVVDSGQYGGMTYDYWGGLQIRNTTENDYLVRVASIPQSSKYGNDLLPVTEGFRIVTDQLNEGDGGVYSFLQSTDVTPDTTYTLAFAEAYMEASGSASNRANRTGLMNELEYRFTGFITAGDDTNWAYDVYSGLVPCPYELWDVESGTRLMPLIYESHGAGRWVSDDYNVVTTMPYYASGSSGALTDVDALHPEALYWDYDPSDPASRSDWAYRWAFSEYDSSEVSPADALWEVGDVWTQQPFKVLKSYAGNSYTFATTAPAIDSTLIDYEDIKVVPNPYYVYAEWDQGENRRKIMFTHVPEGCTIDIYTLSGELVASLDHSGSSQDQPGKRRYSSDRIGTVIWNTWTYEYTEAVYGLYIYVVKVDKQVKKVGKFAIIR